MAMTRILSPIVENWCHTQVQMKKFSFTWMISNFSSILEEMDVATNIKSSNFSAENNGNLKWCLIVYPKGDHEENKDYVSLFLSLVSCNTTEVKVKCTFSIINAYKEKSNTIEYSKLQRFVKGGTWGSNKFIRRDLLLNNANELLPDDKLTLYCEVSIIEDFRNISGQNKVIQFKVPKSHLSEDFSNMFEQEIFTDVVLTATGREFAVHKVILAARSPVFFAMFKHEMEEGTQNRVNITDMNHEVLSEMLYYIYSDKVSNIENMAQDLLAAADKYALDRLKVICEDYLYLNLSISSAADVLILADMHSANQLKVHAIDFINTHATEVMETPGWKKLLITNPQLVADVFRALASQHVPPIGPPQKRMKH